MISGRTRQYSVDTQTIIRITLLLLQSKNELDIKDMDIISSRLPVILATYVAPRIFSSISLTVLGSSTIDNDVVKHCN